MIQNETGRLSREAIIYSVKIAVIFYGVFVLANYIASTRESIQAIQFSWEAAIPFYPGWSLIYLTVSPLLCLAPFIFRSMEELKKMGQAIIAQVLLASVFFILLPLAAPNEGLEVKGWSKWFFRLANEMNLSHNSFPSLHVALSFTAAVFYRSSVKKTYAVFFFIWAALIALSTQLIHEHYFIDLIGGIILVPLSIVIINFQYKNNAVQTGSEV